MPWMVQSGRPLAIRESAKDFAIAAARCRSFCAPQRARE
jgi:hypothetical protein